MSCFKSKFWVAVTLILSSLPALATEQGIPAGRFVDPRPIPGIDFDSRDRLEAVPTLSHDGLELFFITDNGQRYGIYYSQRESVEIPFERPKRLREISSFTFNDVVSSLSSDGLSLYFHSDRSGKVDIHRATRAAIGEPFDNITVLPDGINSNALEGGASVTADGKTIFFDRGGGRGTPGDLYMSIDRGSGFEDAVSLENVNDGYDNAFPSPSADGRFVFFSDADNLRGNGLHPDEYVRADGYGSEDLWVTYRETIDQAFGEPININDLWPESEVNSEARDVTPRVSYDWPHAGSQLYWTTNYRGGEDMMFATWLPNLTGDFDSNEELDVSDIDLLTAEIVSGLDKSAYDLNDDGLVDTVDHEVWIREIKKTWIGDADLDGEFNSGDFVAVFQSGKYETGQFATWSDGDWNADQKFDSGDFVVAFQDGGYESGLRAAITAVPEPTGFTLAAGGVLGLLGLARELQRTGRSRSRTLLLEDCESRRLLTSVGFNPHEIMSTDHLGLVGTELADLDDDGDLDILTASTNDGKVAWYENIDGDATFASQKIIDSSFVGPRYSFVEPGSNPASIIVSDLNADGHQDIVVAAMSYSSDEPGIVWYEHLDGQGAFQPSRVIEVHSTSINQIVAADLDGDGDSDLLVGSGSGVSWIENRGKHGRFGEEQPIIRDDFASCVSIDTGDLDNDGDLDIAVANSCNESGIRFLENLDGKATFQPRKITNKVGSPSISTIDIDGDNDLDILAHDQWFENIDGRATFGTPRRITNETGQFTSLPVDIDNDGDIDVLTRRAYEPHFSWHENVDGQGTFEKRIDINVANRVRSLVAGDLDGDGDADIVTATTYDDTIGWYENRDSLGTFGERIQISKSSSGAWDVVAADLDGDTDLDVITASADDGKIAWHVNEDGSGAFGDQVVIDQTFGIVLEVHATDIDTDGDLDILATFADRFDTYDENGNYLPSKSSMRWYENIDGQGDFRERTRIDDLVNGLGGASGTDRRLSLQIEDMNGDGHQDLVALSHKGVTWYSNRDGSGNFSVPHTIVPDQQRSLTLASLVVDIDSDGDMDVLTSNYNGEFLYENSGDGTFNARTWVTNPDSPVRAFHAADVDDDGDVDVLTVRYSMQAYCPSTDPPTCYYDQLEVAWYKNIDGTGTMSKAQVLGTAAPTQGASKFTQLTASDIDSDGDLDAVFVSSLSDGWSARDRFVWYENTDGKGTFGGEQVISTNTNGINSLAVADIDSDGDLDLISASHFDGKVTWYENRPIGDSNGDGIFDSGDLVAVFKSGEYEDGIENNSTFEEGDWNGDGEFDSSDLVAAFSAGTYAAKSVPVVGEIAATVDSLFDTKTPEENRFAKHASQIDADKSMTIRRK